MVFAKVVLSIFLAFCTVYFDYWFHIALTYDQVVMFL